MENSFRNGIYLAKIPEQCSTWVIEVFAKSYSSLDKGCYYQYHLEKQFPHSCQRHLSPVRSNFTAFGLILISLVWSYPGAQGTREKHIRLGASLQSNSKSNAIKCICTDLLTMGLIVYQKKAQHSQGNNFLSFVCNHLPVVIGVFRAVLCKAASTRLCFSYHRLSISMLKELTSLHQIISLQVSTPWKQIGPKGRGIVIMRERLRGGEKRSQHEV